jgi:hypothetical protein
MDEMVIKIMVELLSTLALATKELKQGRSSKSILPDMLHYSAQRSQICQENFRREGHRLGGGPAETGPTYARRSSDYRGSDTRGRPRSCPGYEGRHGRCVNAFSLQIRRLLNYLPSDGKASVDGIREALGTFIGYNNIVRRLMER